MKEHKKLLSYLFNILIVSLLFCITLKIKDIFPFGNGTLAITDSYYQYQPFLYNFIMSIKTGNLLSYSFIAGLGNPTIFNILYYLNSPLNLIALITDNPEMMFFLVILIKLLMGTVVMTFYSLKRSEDDHFISIVATLGYVFSGWFLAYYFQIMWLDIMMIFPLFKYALDKLLDEEKPLLYIIVLAYIALCNFYLGFSIGCYTIVYFLIKIFSNKMSAKDRIRKFDVIFLSTLTSFLLLAPYVYYLYNSFIKMLIVSPSNLEMSGLHLGSFISGLFYGNAITFESPYQNGLVNLCVSMFIFINFIYYFFNKKINRKYKIISLIELVLFICLFFIPKLDYMFNAFHIPINFLYRYSFLFILFIVDRFIDNMKVKSELNKIGFIFNIGLYGLLIYSLLSGNISLKIYILNLIMISIYSFIILFKLFNKKIVKVLIVLLIIVESLIGLTNSIKENNKIDKIDTYANETFEYRTNTYGAGLNYYANVPSVNFFSSMRYYNTIKILYGFSCKSDWMNQGVCGGMNSVSKLLFNIENNGKYVNKLFTVNSNTLNVIVNTNDDIINSTKEINGYINEIFGIDNINEQIDIEIKQSTIDKNKYYFVIPEDGMYTIKADSFVNYFIYKDKMVLFNMEITYLPSEYENLSADRASYLYYAYSNNFKKGEIVSIYSTIEPKMNFYKVNDDKYNELYNLLKENEIKYTYYKDNHIEGDITVKNDDIIFTSIPYDTNWHIYVDGKETDAIKVFDSLIGIKTSNGEHHIKMVYKWNLTVPIIISIVTGIGLVIFIIKNKKKRK